jgi:16S rRNA processing protein RimM
MAEPRFLLLGEILRPHGVRGELRMRILTDYPERITQLEKVYLAEKPDSSDPDTYRVEHMRRHQSYGLLKLEGIDDRDEADRLRQLLVMVPLEDAVPLEDGEFYLYQLIGLSVRNTAGETLGRISDVLETGANDVYVVESTVHGEFLIPVTSETVLKTDIEEGFILVNLPEGLLR